eukprot:EG_transcript_39147
MFRNCRGPAEPLASDVETGKGLSSCNPSGRGPDTVFYNTFSEVTSLPQTPQFVHRYATPATDNTSSVAQVRLSRPLLCLGASDCLPASESVGRGFKLGT